MYKLKVIAQAQKDLDGFHGKTFGNIKKTILNLSNNPRPIGVIKLTQEEGYRIRVGDYRVLYRIDDVSRLIFIYRVKRRKDAYR